MAMEYFKFPSGFVVFSDWAGKTGLERNCALCNQLRQRTVSDRAWSASVHLDDVLLAELHANHSRGRDFPAMDRHQATTQVDTPQQRPAVVGEGHVDPVILTVGADQGIDGGARL